MRTLMGTKGASQRGELMTTAASGRRRTTQREKGVVSGRALMKGKRCGIKTISKTRLSPCRSPPRWQGWRSETDVIAPTLDLPPPPTGTVTKGTTRGFYPPLNGLKIVVGRVELGHPSLPRKKREGDVEQGGTLLRPFSVMFLSVRVAPKTEPFRLTSHIQ